MLRGRANMVCALIGMTLLLAACGGDDDPMPTGIANPTTAAAGPTATATPVATIEPIVWAASVDPQTNAPLESVEQFTTGDRTIFAVVRVANLPMGAVLSASWTYNDVPLDNTEQAIVPSQAYRAGYVEFHLTRSDDQPWPVGRYELAISLDGSLAQAATINVVDS